MNILACQKYLPGGYPETSTGKIVSKGSSWSSQELQEVYNVNPEDFHTCLVTGDETWLHHWDPDAEKESMQWKHPGSFIPTLEVSYPTISRQGNGHSFLGLQRDYIDS